MRWIDGGSMFGILLDGFEWAQFLVYSVLYGALMLALVAGAIDVLERHGSKPRGRRGEPWSWLVWASPVTIAVIFSAVLSSPGWWADFEQGGIRTLPFTIFKLWFAYMLIMGVLEVVAALVPPAKETCERRASRR